MLLLHQLRVIRIRLEKAVTSKFELLFGISIRYSVKFDFGGCLLVN